MVKTLHGRKPGRKHAKIVKQLRHRRRMAALRAARQSPIQSSSITSCSSISCSTLSGSTDTTSWKSVSTACLPVLERQPEMEHLPLPPNHFYYPLSISTSSSTLSTIKTLSPVTSPVPEHEPEIQLPPKQRHLYFTLSETNCLLSFDDNNSDAVVVKVTDAPAVEEKNKQMILWKISGNRNRGYSEASAVAADGVGAAKNVDRSTVSESDLHATAIPMPAPLVRNVVANIVDDDASTAHEGHFSDDEDEEDEEYHPIIAPPPPSHHEEEEHNRLQHPDEVTDRYLSHLFTPSLANITTHHDEHHTHNDTHSGDFKNLRNLFSSDEHTHSGDFKNLRNLFSSDTQHTKLPTVASETSLGLNTLFNNRTIRNVPSHDDSSFGLNTLFNNRTVRNIPSHDDTSYGLNTLFNNRTIRNVPSHDDTSYGLNTLFNNRTRRMSTHETSESIFDSIFEKYRIAVAEIEDLKKQIAELKKNQA